MLLGTWVCKDLSPPPSSPGWIARSGVAGSSDSAIFNFLRNHPTGSHTGCTTLPSHPQCIRAPFPYMLSSTCYFLFSKGFVSLIVAIVMGVKWYPTVVFIRISLMIRDSEHLLVCSVVISTSHLPPCSWAIAKKSVHNPTS